MNRYRKTENGIQFVAAVCAACMKRLAWVAADPTKPVQLVTVRNAHKCESEAR